MEMKIEELKETYTHIKFISVVCDFSKITTMAQYRELVEQGGINKLDIGIICLNAGLGAPGAIDQVEDERYESVWSVNCLHPAYLLKALVNQQMNRDKRSAVLITSSMCSEMVLAV